MHKAEQSPKSKVQGLKSDFHPDFRLWTSDFGLVVEDLQKAFHQPSGERLEVLKGVSLSVRAGEAVAITGASGAGKSTLLHLLGGLEAADAGLIRLGDYELTKASAGHLARVRNEMIGFVFQFHHLLPDLTAAENVALPLLINRQPGREARARANSFLKSVGLEERAAQRVGNLSGGEQQRVAVARALIKGPRLVLADEPTGNLDAAVGDEIGLRLASFARQHQAIVIIATHNERLTKVCDRVLSLKEGRLEGI